MISQEDMKVLSAFEDIFKRALLEGYYRNLGMKIFSQLNDVFERVFGHRFNSQSWGCPHCNFRFITQLATAYFEQKRYDDGRIITQEQVDKAKTEALNSGDARQAMLDTPGMIMRPKKAVSKEPAKSKEEIKRKSLAKKKALKK